MRILIAEDEEGIRSRVGRIAESQGHEVAFAEDGLVAWNLLSGLDAPFDLLITDVRMPNLDGMSLLRRMREAELDVEVAIMTGHGDLDMAIEAVQLGALDFLTKPFGRQDVVRLLRRLSYVYGQTETELAGRAEVDINWPYVDGVLRLNIASDPTLVSEVAGRVRDQMRTFLQRNGVNRRVFMLCMVEALQNAITHGNLGVSSNMRDDSLEEFDQALAAAAQVPALYNKIVGIELAFNDKQLSITVTDEGGGFNPIDLPDPNDPMALLSSGRGLIIIREFMDEVTWNERGNAITMVKRLPA